MKKVEVYGSKLCPYCHQAEAFLKKHNIPYEWKDIKMVGGMKLPTENFKAMKRRSKGQTTVPQIFVDGKHYGDEETLVDDERKGRLDTVFR